MGARPVNQIAMDEVRIEDEVVEDALDLRWVANIGNWSRQLPLPPASDNDRLRQVYEADAADARYIAAADPTTILALVAVVEAARAAMPFMPVPDEVTVRLTNGGPTRVRQREAVFALRAALDGLDGK